MKATVNQISDLKKKVSSVCGLVSNKTGNPNEECILVEAEGSEIKLSCMQSGSHKATLTIQAEVGEEGSAYIPAKKLLSMVKKLQGNVEQAEIFLSKKSMLGLRVNVYGSITESIYHNQNAFGNAGLCSNRFTELSPDCSNLNLVLNYLTSTCNNYPNVKLKFTKEGLYVYGQFATSGFSRYFVNQLSKKEYEIYLKHPLLKYVSCLGEAYSATYNSSARAIKLSSDTESLALIGQDIRIEEFSSVDYLLNQESTSSMVVNLKEFSSCIDWQSYNSTDLDAIELWSKDSKIFIQGSKLEEAASIDCTDGTSFEKISLSIRSIKAALKAVAGKYDLLSIRQLKLDIQDTQIKILILEPGEESYLGKEALIYEQIHLS